MSNPALPSPKPQPLAPSPTLTLDLPNPLGCPECGEEIQVDVCAPYTRCASCGRLVRPGEDVASPSKAVPTDPLHRCPECGEVRDTRSEPRSTPDASPLAAKLIGKEAFELLYANDLMVLRRSTYLAWLNRDVVQVLAELRRSIDGLAESN